MALLESLRLTLILTLCVAPGFAQTASYTDDNPSVSPDGKKIAFMSDRDWFNAKLRRRKKSVRTWRKPKPR
jgi:hypothetical protein